jgi:hypothetical protein
LYQRVYRKEYIVEYGKEFFIRIYNSKEDEIMNFFAIPVFSFVPPKYRELVEESGGKIFGALLICFIILSTISGVRAAYSLGDFAEMFDTECPDFELKNGVFSIEEPYVMEEDGTYVEIDDSIGKVPAGDVEAVQASGDYENVCIVGSESVGIYNEGKYQVFNFEDFGDFGISKQQLSESLFPAIKVIIIVGFIIGAFISIGIYYLVALILQFAVGAIAKSAFKLELSDRDRFRTTVLGKFPPHVLVYILGLPGIHISLIVNLILQLGYISLVLYFRSKEDAYTYE